MHIKHRGKLVNTFKNLKRIFHRKPTPAEEPVKKQRALNYYFTFVQVTVYLCLFTTTTYEIGIRTVRAY